MRDKWVALLADILVSATVSGVASFVGYALMKAFPMEAAITLAFLGIPAILYLLVYGCLYGGAIYMIANGIWKWRPGRILGPLLLVGGIATFSHVTLELQHNAAAAADTRILSIEGQIPNTIALENQNTFCLSPCIQILATTKFDVAVRPNSQRPWTLFHKAAGAVCEDDEHRNRTIAFLRLGYLGVCTGRGQYDANVTDAILIAQDSDSRGNWAGAVSFTGNVAYVARVNNGTMTILGRWIKGRIEPAFQTFLGPLRLAPKSVVIGTPFEMKEVYSAVGLTVLDSDRPGPAPIPALLAELERFGDTTKVGMGVSDQFRVLLKETNDPTFIAGYLTRMLNSANVEDRKLALLALESLKGKDIEFAKPALAKGLLSRNRDEVYRSAVIVGRMSSNERDFAMDGLIAASLRFIGDIDDDRMRKLLSRLLKDAARDTPDFSARLDAWTPADDVERRHLAKIKNMLAR